ncbi:MAG: hypothetical protein NTZ63_07175 [Candidatus Omnitrophica bacterium]|nr:hypothetical protein [Candidatus Omnitrophota bacterium]
MEKLKETIQNVFKELVAKKDGVAGPGPEGWLKKVLTKNELGHIKFQYLRKGVLGIIVDSSACLYSLNLKKASLISKLKKISSEVQEIRLSIGDIK